MAPPDDSQYSTYWVTSKVRATKEQLHELVKKLEKEPLAHNYMKSGWAIKQYWESLCKDGKTEEGSLEPPRYSQSIEDWAMQRASNGVDEKMQGQVETDLEQRKLTGTPMYANFQEHFKAFSNKTGKEQYLAILVPWAQEVLKTAQRQIDRNTFMEQQRTGNAKESDVKESLDSLPPLWSDTFVVTKNGLVVVSSQLHSSVQSLPLTDLTGISSNQQ